MLFKRMATTNVSQRVLNFSKDQQFANKWYTSLPDTRYRFTDTVVSNGRLFAGSAGLVFELNPVTGEVLQKYQVSDLGQETHVATDGTTLFVGCYGYAYGIRLNDWSKLGWTTGMTGASYCAVQLLCSNGRLFAGSNSTMHEIDVNDGTRKRSKGLSSSVGSDVHLATDGKSIFAGCYGYAYCVPVDNWDKLTWTATMTGSTYTSVRLLYAGGRLFAGSNGAAHEMNLATGDRLRSKDLSKLADQEVHLATDGHTLFAGCHAYAYGLNLSDDWSNLAWTTPMSGKLYDLVELLHYDGQLYAGSNGYILNLEATTGAVIKSFMLASLGGSGDYTATLALDQKSGLFVGMHGYVYNVTL